jgi:hypothetical protein
MKKVTTILILIGLLLVGISYVSKAQTVDTVLTTKVDSSLYKMTKMQLTDLYLDEVTKLAFASPYTPFTIGVNDTIHGELDIPVSKYIARKREKIMEVSKAYGETMKEKLYELIPYSDKNDIIRAILFLREMNNDIKK